MGAIVAVLGFDERHVLRSILRLGFRGVDEVHLILPSTGLSDRRASRAVESIRDYASAAGIDGNRVLVHVVNHSRFEDAVTEILAILYRVASGGRRVTLSLGGGMRALVIEAFAAAYSLPEDVRRLVTVVADFESGDGYVEYDLSKPLTVRIPSGLECDVLRKLSGLRSATPTELSRALGIPKSTAWKVLNDLLSEGLVVRGGGRGKYSLTAKGRKVSELFGCVEA